MNFVILASFIAVCLILSGSLRRQKKIARKEEQKFWEREYRANSVRRKPLDGLPFVNIPLETFPTEILQDNPDILECISIIEALTSQKVVNLTGYTNTDLKLEYGTANITELSEYDQNYTVLVRTLQKWADILLANDYVREACVLLEFAVSTGSDITRTYTCLADAYVSWGQFERIADLIQAARALRSSNKTVIIKTLQKQHPII